MHSSLRITLQSSWSFETVAMFVGLLPADLWSVMSRLFEALVVGVFFPSFFFLKTVLNGELLKRPQAGN